MNDIINHYDLLIDEKNDPVRDPQVLRDYMDKWDGQIFINSLQLNKNKNVLEIGVGTGRLALKVIPNCKHFTGIDFSPKTFERAIENLERFDNKTLICGDFFDYCSTKKFDIIYSSLVLWHIKEKQAFIDKVASLLSKNGRFVLSIADDQSEELDFTIRKIHMYPDTIEDTVNFLKKSNLKVTSINRVEFGTVFTAEK